MQYCFQQNVMLGKCIKELKLSDIYYEVKNYKYIIIYEW